MNPYVRATIWLIIVLLCLAIWEYALPGAGIFFGSCFIGAAILATVAYAVDHWR